MQIALRENLHPKMRMEDSYLVDKGLIPLPEDERVIYREAAEIMPKLSM